MGDGGKKQTRAIIPKAGVVKIQAGDTCVARQRARQHAAAGFFEMRQFLELELCEGRVAGGDTLQKLLRQVRMVRFCERGPVDAHEEVQE